MLSKAAIILAGGSGSRYQDLLPKQFKKLNDKMIIEYSIEAFLSIVDIIVLILHPQYFPLLKDIYSFNPKIHYCEGGSTRQHSVLNGLQYLSNLIPDLVAIHDAARPLLNKKLIENGFDIAKIKKSAIPILPLSDSLWQYCTTSLQPVNRDNFCSSQTPQTFNYREIYLAHLEQKKTLEQFTDCASVYYHTYQLLTTYLGEKNNIKLTSPQDFHIISYLYNNIDNY